MKMNSTVWWVIGLLVVIGGLIAWSSAMRSAPPASGEGTGSLAISVDDHTKGAENSSVVLVEYLDFECKACGAYYPIVKQMEEEFGDRVTFVVRYFPLSGHRNGLSSALAVEAASRQGKFWEMHDLLYTRQSEWGDKQIVTPQVFEAYAQELGLDMEQFKADVASADVAARVQRDLADGRKLGVNSTPTFFLNGEKLKNPQSPEEFRSLIQTALGS